MLGVEYDRRVFSATSDMDAGKSFISVSGREVNFQIVATKIGGGSVVDENSFVITLKVVQNGHDTQVKMTF